MSPIRTLAAFVAVAAALGLTPATQAETGFSISIQGGDHFTHGHINDRRYGPYSGDAYGDRHHGYPSGYPGYYGHYRYEPYWQPGDRYRRFWYERPPGPRCIYRHGYRYCR